MKARLLGCFVFGVMASSAVVFAQGSLTPPGPPGETMRTLQQIEPRTPIASLPFTISEPGSYYLAYSGSATEPTNRGVWITVSDVVLDLNGFTLSGSPGSSTHGIEVAPSAHVTIRNGTIKNWGGNGIEAPEVTNLVVENVVLKNNAGHGIHFSSGELGGVDSHDNGGAGVFASKPVPGIGIVVKKNPQPAHVQRNAGGGVVIEGDFDVELSGVIHNNTGHGIAWTPVAPTDGLRLKLEDCDSSANTGDGLHLAGPSSAEARCEMADVTFSHNGGGGVFVSKPVPGIGIVVKKNPGSGARISNNGAGGLVLAGDCDVEFAGLVSGNTGPGISWEPQNPADRITFKATASASVHNTGDGLHFAASGPVAAVCDLADFSCAGNGGDGVHIALPHPGSYLSILHHQGRLMDNGGDGMDISAGRSGNQGFFDVVMSRNASKGGNKVDGGSNPGIVEHCVVQDNGSGGLNLEGGSWTLADSVVQGNGGAGVAVGARKRDPPPGHVTLIKRGTTTERNAGAGVLVYPLEDDAQIQVVVEDSHLVGNAGPGLQVRADRPGSGGSVAVRDSSASGNAGNGIALDSTAASAGLAYQIAGGDCDDNGAGGIAIVDPRATGGTVRGTRVSGNAANGLDIEGGAVTLESCEIRDNGGDGVALAAREHEKKGHVTLIKRGGSAERNGGNGVRVYAAEPGAECQVVLDRARLSANASNGLQVAATPPGSSIDLEWLASSASGNGGSGMLIVPVAMDKGLRFRAAGGDCDDNVAGGITVDGDAVDVCTVRGLTLSGNGSWGINARGGTWRLADCVAADNPEGGFRMHKPIQVYRGRWGDFAFADCDAVRNGLAGIGIYGFDPATTARVDIAGGRVAGNTGGAGIDLNSSPGSKGRIHGVAVADNTGHGIYSEGSGWSITDSRVAGNGGTGIFVAGNGHQLSRNELADNAIGIYLEGTGNAARENTFSGLAPGGGLPQTPYIDGSGANAIAPDQNVVTGVNPLGNILF